jgi:hypothetical protein
MIVTAGIDTITTLPSPAMGLLPAVHDASVDAFESTLPDPETGEPVANTLPPPAPGMVLLVNGGTTSLPAYGSWPAQRAQSGQFVASDGRFWFRVRRYNQTNSFYPEVFERTLYSFAFTAVSLPLRQRWSLSRDFDFRLFSNNTDAVWNVVWEVGDRYAETSPAPIGPNLDGYNWRTPLIDQQVHITDVVGRHRFEISLYRDVGPDGEFWTGTAARYGKTLAAQSPQLPLSNDFVLRLRLSCFDIENNVPDPRGFIAYFATQPKD